MGVKMVQTQDPQWDWHMNPYIGMLEQGVNGEAYIYICIYTPVP